MKRKTRKKKSYEQTFEKPQRALIGCPKLVPQDDKELVAEEETGDESEEDDDEEKNLCQSERISKGIERPSRYAVATVKLKVTILMERKGKRL